MTAEIVQLCRFDGCRRRAAHPGQARCDEHRLRWMPGEAPEPVRRPAWVERLALNSKDFSGSAA